LTAALRRGPRAPGNPARQTQRPAVMTTLYVRDESGFREADPNDVLHRAQTLLAQRFRAGSPVLTSPALTREFLRLHLAACDHEVFGLIHLDSRHRLIAVENLFRGTINSSSVHPREVVKSVLAHNAAAVVLYHNHPLCCVAGVNMRVERRPQSLKKGNGGLALNRLTAPHLMLAPGPAHRNQDTNSAVTRSRASQPRAWPTTTKRSMGMKIALVARRGTGIITQTVTAATRADLAETNPRREQARIKTNELTASMTSDIPVERYSSLLSRYVLHTPGVFA
jgi:DNA repair protein RadC